MKLHIYSSKTGEWEYVEIEDKILKENRSLAAFLDIRDEVPCACTTPSGLILCNEPARKNEFIIKHEMSHHMLNNFVPLHDGPDKSIRNESDTDIYAVTHLGADPRQGIEALEVVHEWVVKNDPNVSAMFSYTVSERIIALAKLI